MQYKMVRHFCEDESGQGITEYACILAFVSLLIITVFGFSNGSLEASISGAFSSIVNQMTQINNAVNQANT